MRRSSRLRVVRGPPSDDEAGSEEKGGHSETTHEDGGWEGGEAELVPGGGGGESAPAAAEAKEKKGDAEPEKKKSAAAVTEAAKKSELLLAPLCLRRRCRRELPLSLLPLHRREEKEEDMASPVLLPLGPAAGCSIAEAGKKNGVPRFSFSGLFSAQAKKAMERFFSDLFSLACVTCSCVCDAEVGEKR